MATFKSIDAARKGFPQRFGHYELLAKLATGGMGEVFLARNRAAGDGFHKLVVLKRVLPHLMDQPRFVRMFQHEARIAARINHTNVCQTYELGSADGMYYMTMEYLEGVTFNHVIKRRKLDWRLADLRLVGRFLTQAAEGLHAAHELRDEQGELVGVVHRDVCHSNIFITSTGVAKLLDFGVAKARGAMEKTRTGVVKGTYAYSAPEQLRGEAVDRRSDVFGLGIVCWEAVTGRRLFRRETDFLVFKAITEEQIPSPLDVRPDIPPELALVIERALSRSPGARYASAREMGAAVERALRPLGPPLSSVAVASLLESAFADDFAQQRRLCGEVDDDTETEDHETTADRRTMPTVTKPYSTERPTVPDLPLKADTEEMPAMFEGMDSDLPDFEVTPVNDGIHYSAMTPLPQPDTPMPIPAPEVEEQLEPDPASDTIEEPARPIPVAAGPSSDPEIDLETEGVSPIEPISKGRGGVVAVLVVACAVAFAAIGYLLWHERSGGEAASPQPEVAAAAAPQDEPVAPELAVEPEPEPPPEPEPEPEPEPAAAAEPDAGPALVAEIESAEVVEPEPAPEPRRRKQRPRRKKLRKPPRPSGPPGFLTIAADPYGTVWIDGKKIGVTPIVRAELSPGKHRVRAVSSADGSEQRFVVNVSAGKATRKKISW